FLAGITWISGCKSPSQAFSYQKNINIRFFKEVPAILGDSARIDSIKVYRAVLKEKLVERDAIPEYKLINTESKQPAVDFVVSKNFHQLYLFRLFTTPPQDDLCVFL